MSFTPTPNLIPDPAITLRDQQHAAKLFNVDQFRLAPKHKFLFHVAFGINKGALANLELVQRYGAEINMLVKSIDLPSFAISTEMLNQYNRKKVVQYQHKPQEIAIKFHDDNMGLINQLWQNYYSYYYADSKIAGDAGAYSRNATRSYDYVTSSYGLDNGSTAPFFDYIKIYQMARHEYVCYQLWNPIFTSWNHNKLDYSQNAVNDFDAKILYEAVSYSAGIVSEDDPEGFGTSHYDVTPSPLSGVPESAANVPSFASGGLGESSTSILNSVITQINTAQNTKQPSGTSLNNLASSTTQTLNGLQGFAFPISK